MKPEMFIKTTITAIYNKHKNDIERLYSAMQKAAKEGHHGLMVNLGPNSEDIIRYFEYNRFKVEIRDRSTDDLIVICIKWMD